jgi:hypothetical protein
LFHVTPPEFDLEQSSAHIVQKKAEPDLGSASSYLVNRFV